MDDQENASCERKSSLYDMRDNPIVRSFLVHKASKVFNEFSELLQKKDLSNKDIDSSLVVMALDEIFNDTEKTFHLEVPKGTELYRCRDISDSKHIVSGRIKAEYTMDRKYVTKGYSAEDSKEPPLFKPGAARANIAGMSYLYLAEDPYTAIAEIRPSNHSYVSLATFSLCKDANVIDLKTNQRVSSFEAFEREHELSIATLITYTMQHFGTPPIDPSIYRVTQFVADYIRKAGFDGVRYQSAMSAGTNITLFNSHRSRVEFVASKVVLVHTQHLNIVDLESGAVIPSAVDEEWRADHLADARDELIRIVDHSDRHSVGKNNEETD